MRPITLVSDNERFMRIHRFPGEGASNDTGVVENVDSDAISLES